MARPQFSARRHRAHERLLAWQRAEPWRAHYWRAVDQVRAEHAHKWPRYCYLPIEGAGPIVADAWRAYGRTPTPGALVQEVSELATYAAWRMSLGIYRYDPDLAAALVTTPLTGDLPAQALQRLPEWCVYIETSGRTVTTTTGPTALHGLYAWIDCPVDAEHDVLTLGLDTDLPLTQTHVPLVGTIDQSLAAVVESWQDAYDRGNALTAPRAAYREEARATLPPLIALVLYLCADEADFGRDRPQRPTATRTKQGWRLFPASGITHWDVGTRLGAALRHASAASGDAHPHAGPRPHIRRAHWHTFLAGPRTSEARERKVQWLPPIPVNITDLDGLPATIHEIAGVACDICGTQVPDAAITLGWPIRRAEDGLRECPDCFGIGAYCLRGHLLPSSLPPVCPSCGERV